MDLKKIFGSSTTPEVKEAIDDSLPERIEGKIFYIDEEGWGFITSTKIPFTRIFFHWSALEQDTLNFKDLKKGMVVEFTPKEQEGKGWRAIRIIVKD